MQATIRAGLIIVPDEYNRNQYWACCWLYLNQDKNLSFIDFKSLAIRKKDNIARFCRQETFDEVKNKMSLERVYETPKAAIQNGTQIAHALEKAAGLGLPPKPPEDREERPNNESYRQEAKSFIATYPLITYKIFKEYFPENFMNPSSFDAWKRDAHMEKSKAEMDAALEEESSISGGETLANPQGKIDGRKQKGYRPDSDTGKIITFMATLRPDEREDLSFDAFQKKTGLRKITSATFYQCKNKLKKMGFKIPPARGSIVSDNVGRPVKIHVPKTHYQEEVERANESQGIIPRQGRRMQIIGEIVVKDYDVNARNLIKKGALEVAKMAWGETVSVITLTDPPTLEIRVQA